MRRSNLNPADKLPLHIIALCNETARLSGIANELNGAVLRGQATPAEKEQAYTVLDETRAQYVTALKTFIS